MNFQLAIFFKQHITRPDQFFSNINDAAGNLFDRMPQIIPLPDEVPPEIPRVTATNQSGVYNFNISLNRLDFTINVTDSQFNESEALSDFILKSKLIVKNIPAEIDIIRLGMIGNYFEIERLPAISLAKKYSKKDLGNVNEFTFRYNKISQDFGFSFNNVFSISNAEINTKGITADGVFIQKDINNHPSGSSIKKDMVMDILSKKIKELSTNSLEGLS
ncbi:TPA: hypothetical protein ACJJ1E_005046 [Enterobacter kobei]